MFFSYYKLLIAFNDFRKQGRATTQKGRNKVKKGTFIGAFLAVLAKGFVYYWTKPDFTNGYKYSPILGKLLDSWDSSNSTHQKEGSSTTLKAIQGRRYQASVYPTGHAAIHLADVVFFKIGDTVWKHRSQTFNDFYLGVLEHDYLFIATEPMRFQYLNWERQQSNRNDKNR
ncbi:hypothetical protein DSO57_1013593 [Entomophthora muscae]|uniref:Uncharacterized protein n=1 Tax=Entomophthora muscae TaxID=34485 RepID=A0ACC2RWT5_9FUNG|nr:hypothetical protein DSO57_1013593 [Entomophthora muscae]